MENNKFEKRKKGIVDVFKALVLVYVFSIAYNVVFKILYWANLIKHDVTELTLFGYIITLIGLAFSFWCLKLAKKESVYAGVFGILVGIFQFLVGGLLWQIIGILLFIDSIMYLVYYKKA